MIDDFSAAKPLSSPPNGVCAPRFRAVQTSLPSTMRCALARRVRKSDCVVVKEHEFVRASRKSFSSSSSSLFLCVQKRGVRLCRRFKKVKNFFVDFSPPKVVKIILHFQ